MQQLKAPSCPAVCYEISRFSRIFRPSQKRKHMLSRNTGIKLPGDCHIPAQINLYQFTFHHNGQQQAMATFCTAFVIEAAFLYGISTQNANSTRQFIGLVCLSITALYCCRSIERFPAKAN
jgi:hypothetical protein